MRVSARGVQPGPPAAGGGAAGPRGSAQHAGLRERLAAARRGQERTPGRRPAAAAARGLTERAVSRMKHTVLISPPAAL